MKRKMYKSPGGEEVFEYAADGSQDAFIPEHLIPMTDAEIEAHLNPPSVPLTLEQIQELRRRAYVAESDPIKNESEYDALIAGTAPDYTAWMAAVEAIKARYPLPAAPEPEAA